MLLKIMPIISVSIKKEINMEKVAILGMMINNIEVDLKTTKCMALVSFTFLQI